MWINRLFGFALILGSATFLGLNSVQAGELTRSDRCNSIGRVIRSYDSGIKDGEYLCQDGQLIVGNGLKVLVGCLQGRKPGWISAGRYDVNELCVSESPIEDSCWFLFGLVDCNRSINEIALITPRSSVVLSTPNLEWRKVEGATNYEVFVDSDSGESYRIRTEETQVNLSRHHPWKSGNFYQIRIIASGKGEILSEGKFAIRIPSKQEIQELEQLIALIESRNFSMIDQVRLINSVYMSHGLIYESIKYIETAAVDTKSLVIARLLARLYSEVEDPEKATENFQIVAKESPQDSEDREFAEKMLQRIAQYQARANFQSIRN